MIRKSMPSGHDPMGGTGFLKERDEIMVRFNLIGS
jgi:hypothetical protein